MSNLYDDQQQTAREDPQTKTFGMIKDTRRGEGQVIVFDYDLTPYYTLTFIVPIPREGVPNVPIFIKHKFRGR